MDINRVGDSVHFRISIRGMVWAFMLFVMAILISSALACGVLALRIGEDTARVRAVLDMTRSSLESNSAEIAVMRLRCLR